MKQFKIFMYLFKKLMSQFLLYFKFSTSIPVLPHTLHYSRASNLVIFYVSILCWECIANKQGLASNFRGGPDTFENFYRGQEKKLLIFLTYFLF